MPNLITRIANKLSNKTVFVGEQKELLSKLNLSAFKFNSYLPHSASSLKYSTLSAILNDVILNDRVSVIEFGSGISTIYLAKLAAMDKKNLKITSVDSDANWIAIMSKILKNEEIVDYVEFVHSPMANCELALDGNKWYNLGIIRSKIDNTKFDQVIIDGPLAYKKEIELSRYPALPFIKDSLMQSYTIILDDTNRKGEKQVLKMWDKNFDCKFRKLGMSASICQKDSHFNIV